jgi:hypothetical protein
LPVSTKSAGTTTPLCTVSSTIIVFISVIAASRPPEPTATGSRVRLLRPSSTSASDNGPRTTPLWSTIAMVRRSSPPLSAISAGNTMNIDISAGPSTVPMTKLLERTRSRYSRAMTVSTLLMPAPPAGGEARRP